VRSIRIFLIAAILAVLTLFNFVAALQGYSSSLKEANKLFDQHLRQTAELIARLYAGHPIKPLDDESTLAYQVWQGQKLLASFGIEQTRPITDFYPGFGHANFDGYRWRTLVYYDQNHRNWIITAERTDLRYRLAESVISHAILPILLSIPLAGLLIWLIISHGLKPLRMLSQQLKNKQADDLSPVVLPELKSELQQVNQSINALMSRLEVALNREKHFTADAAHELRTPISALKIQLHNLEEDISPDNEAFQQLRAGVDRIQHLVEQLLSLYRSTPEQLAHNFCRIDLHQLAQDVIAELHTKFETKQQIAELAGQACMIEGDPFALTTLLQNLLNNASKYTPPGGHILVTVSTEGHLAYLKVEDSGPGIAPEDYDKIFKRFQRLNNKPDGSTTPGCGLGLTIVRNIADLHRARIEIEHSRFESGTAFIIIFTRTED
tara:strand:+ start:73 stop:1383 length:1311 start_codon:yes stop_codon:yes gene_type:complete